jgi:hypothetical protein
MSRSIRLPDRTDRAERDRRRALLDHSRRHPRHRSGGIAWAAGVLIILACVALGFLPSGQYQALSRLLARLLGL